MIHSLDEIPSFRDECEEVEFWNTHAMSDELWESLRPVAESELPPVRARQAVGRPDDVVVAVAIPKSHWQALRQRVKTGEVTVLALIRGRVLDRLAEWRMRVARRESARAHNSPILNLLLHRLAVARPSTIVQEIWS